MRIGDLFRYKDTYLLVVVIDDKQSRAKTGWVSVKVIATGERCRVPKQSLTKI